MAEKFEVYQTDNDGVTWTKILDTIEGTFPAGGEDTSGRIWCFYVHNSDTLRMVYSDDQGENWSDPADIVVAINEASLSFWIDEFGFHWISYWKDDKAYAAFHNPSDEPNVWTSMEVAE